MSEIRVNKLIDEAGTGSVELTQGATIPNSKNITGGGGINITCAIVANGGVQGTLTGTASTATAATNAYGLSGAPNISVGTIGAGNVTSTGDVSAVNGTYSGNLNVAGTLTYEDVTNQDVIGLSTFRAGVIVSAGGINATGVYKGNITVISGTAIDCSLGNYFTKTITGPTTFTFTNVPTSCVYSMTIEITCNGSNSITWPTPNVKWPIDTAPPLTDGKTQMFTFITDDGGTRWRGNSAVDYTN